MKSNFLMGLIAMSFLFVMSCEKSTDNTSNAIEADATLNDATVTTTESLDALADLESLENELVETRSNPTCPTITSTAPKGTFPNVVTIDFGAGCTTTSGRYHSGKIVIEQSDSMIHNGAVRKTTFIDFGIDSLRMKNGTVTLTNNGTDAAGNKKVTRKVSNMIINAPKGEITLNSTHTRTQIKGGNTSEKSDDVWKIQGESTGITMTDKVVYSAIITEGLIKKEDCPFIVSGKETFTRKGHTTIVDYGDGVCDRFATVLLENGNKIIITLKPRY